jgi:hypothetical protein
MESQKSEKELHIEKCEFWRGTKKGICPKYPQPKQKDAIFKEKNKKGQTLAGLIIGIIIFFLIVATILAFSIIRIPIEENRGSQSGYITTIETNGIIFKTYSLYIKSSLESSQEERYCIELEDKKILIDAMEKGKKVKIYFYDYISRGIGYCKSEDLDIVYKVEVLI